MNVFARIEGACARVVEDAFARVFPSALEPEQISRRLIAVAQSAPGDLYLVRVHPSDYARLAPDRALLEGRWSAMLRETLAAGSDPRVVLDEDPDVVAGSLAIEPVGDERRAPALAFAMRDGSRLALADGMTIGRGADNTIPLRDPRVSRRHARVVADDDAWAIEDASSANGTFIDGARVERARLKGGQTLTIGDTSFAVMET